MELFFCGLSRILVFQISGGESTTTTAPTTAPTTATLADLDCRFSRPAAEDRPGSGFGL